MSPDGVDQGFVMGLFCKDSFHGFFCLRGLKGLKGLKGSMPAAFHASRFMVRVPMLCVSGFAFHAFGGSSFAFHAARFMPAAFHAARFDASRFMLRVSMLRVSGCAFQCCAFQASRFNAARFRLHVSGFTFQASRLCFAFQASRFKLRVSGFAFMLRVSGFAFHAFGVSSFAFQFFRGLQVQNLLFAA